MGTIETIGSRKSDEAPSAWLQEALRLKKVVAAAPSAFVRLQEALERRRTRWALLQLSDEQLKDIGISRADAENEARRSLWI
ncbi:MAG TPA: DUF1127 domain-containing protein [Afifellaceae bacterium]|nr:DUF1127 domain-containing protein [Afifellaceae bacterium]